MQVERATTPIVNLLGLTEDQYRVLKYALVSYILHGGGGVEEQLNTAGQLYDEILKQQADT